MTWSQTTNTGFQPIILVLIPVSMDFVIVALVGMNWIVATGDPYAAQRKLDSSISNTCPDFVAKGKSSSSSSSSSSSNLCYTGLQAPRLFFFVLNSTGHKIYPAHKC